MAIINFPFEKKEGKYFSPIVSEKTTYKVENGVIVTDSTTLVNGVKGVYNKVRLTLPASKSGSYHELYAINSETVYSSN